MVSPSGFLVARCKGALEKILCQEHIELCSLPDFQVLVPSQDWLYSLQNLMKNENVEPLVQNLFRISSRWQLSLKASLGPLSMGPCVAAQVCLPLLIWGKMPFLQA